jgi:hypothetical protein
LTDGPPYAIILRGSGPPAKIVKQMDFEVVGAITNVEVIAAGRGVRDRARLHRQYGRARWRKLKGVADVRLSDGVVCRAEVHWYESHGVGRKEMKLKTLFLDD